MVSMVNALDMALRGALFLVAIVVALVLAFSPVGDAIKEATADGRGYYYPKLVFMLCLLVAAVPMLPVYFVLRLIIGAKPARR